MNTDRAITGHRPSEKTPNETGDTIPKASAGDLVKEARDRLTAAYTFDKQNREDAALDLKFLAGDQWPEFAKQARINRPMLTVNKLPQFLHQVTNDIRQSSPVIKVTPVDGKNDPNLAKVFDGILSDIQYRSSAKHVYATAAYHAAACGIGHWRVLTKYVEEDGFDQELAVELIPYPMSVYWDPAAVKPDRSDAMWCLVVDMMPSDTFKMKYPDAMATSVDDFSNAISTGTNGIFWATSDYVLVAEYWRKVPDKKTIAAFESGQTVDITGFNFLEMYQMQMQHGQVVKKRDMKCHRVEHAIVSGAEVLSPPSPWIGRHIPVVPVIGNEIPLDRMTVRHGLIRNARDPQQLYNFYRSAAAEHIALSPKSPYLVTDAMIENHKGDWDSLNTKNRPYLRYTPDPSAPGNKPERIAAPEPPQALWQEAQVATDDIKATTGIYDASLGAKSNETSGVAIKRREVQGDTANFHYQDNLLRSIEHSGRIMIDLIPKVYDNQRTVRLLGEDGAEDFAPINTEIYLNGTEPVLVNDLSQGRFDIRVTIGPSYATKRLEAADALIELMKTLQPEQSAAIADLAAKNMDIPEAQEAAKRLKATVPRQLLLDPDQPPPPPPDPMQDPMYVAELNTKLAAAQKSAADAHKIELETWQQFMTPALPQSPPLPSFAMQMGGSGMPPPVMPEPEEPAEASGEYQE